MSSLKRLSQLLTLLFVTSLLGQLVYADEARNDKITSKFGELFICSLIVPTLDSDGFIKHCSDEMTDNDSEVRITLNGKTIWRDEGLLVFFDSKYNGVDADGKQSELFLFRTSTGGTACPLELTAIVISDKGIRAHGPFGNCMDTEGVQIEKTNDGVHFLFECWSTHQCKNYDREFAYTCFVSNDINQSISCEGEAYCSAYSNPEDTQLYYWDSATQSVKDIKDCNIVDYE